MPSTSFLGSSLSVGGGGLGAIGNATTFLRVAPVVTSTLSLMYAGDQYLFLSNFLRIPPPTPSKYSSSEDPDDKVDSLVGPYFNTFFPPGLAVVFTTYGSSVAFGAVNAYFYYRSSSASFTTFSSAKVWYAAGTVFAAAHFAFVPLVMDKVKALVTEEESKRSSSSKSGRRSSRRSGGKKREQLADWLKIHAIRSLAVDLPAWGCFLLAAGTGLRPVLGGGRR